MSGIVRFPTWSSASSAVQPDASAADTVQDDLLIDDCHYAESLTNRFLRCLPGMSQPRRNDTADTYLFVVAGSGKLHLPDQVEDLARGSAALIRAGISWHVEVSSGELLISDTQVPTAPLPYAQAFSQPAQAVSRPVVRLGESERESATAAREFEVLFDPSRGSAGATAFVGFIPPSGAPAHYHLYDEICCIVRGHGVLHAGGESVEISTGSTFHIPPRFLHAVENTADEDLWILGVFRPAGSAAKAYFPDGRPAPNNQEETPAQSL